jgi:hypothetical protein
MDLTPLLCVIRATERPILLLIRGLLVVVSVVSTVSTILVMSSVSRVDFPVVLLLLCGPLAMGLKKLSLCFQSLDACVRDYGQISYHLRLLYGDLLDSLDVADSVVEGVDDLDILSLQDSVSGVAEMFDVVP